MTSARPLAIGALLALAQLFANGSDARSSNAQGAPSPEAVTSRAREISFRRDIAPVLATSCALASCHGGGSRPPVLAPGDPSKMRAALVDIASEDRPDHAYVQPGAPEASYLLQKIDGRLVDAECTEHDCGSPMPLDNPSLSPGARQAIRAWIVQGARDN
jgi:hypothetical protein